MGRPKKVEDFSLLSEEFTASVNSASEDAVRRKISDAALDEVENQKLKREDPDLSSLKEQLKEAGVQYKERSKVNKLKIKYCQELLEGQGKV
jgi:hypothetical protein